MMEASRLLHTCLLLLLVTVVVCGGGRAQQIPIPARTDGFVYGGGGEAPEWGETVLVESFFDLVCPDSRDAWPVLKKAVERYGSRVSVVVHLFPLPYHSYAFIACRSIHTVNKLNPTFVFPLLERFFKYQEGYYNQPTYTKSRETVVDEVTNKLVIPTIGKTNLVAYKAGFNDSQSDQAARISFKNGCARGVTGTPYFFVNGIPLNIWDSIDYNNWTSILDPLVGKM